VNGHLKKIVAERILNARKAKGLTQEELGKQLGMSSSSISSIENSRRNLTLETIAKIASVLDVEPSFLLGVNLENEKLPRVVADAVDSYPELPEEIISVYKDFYSKGIIFEKPEEYYYLWKVIKSFIKK
jgi:transcriptional regulator with XRE-family HTH domain